MIDWKQMSKNPVQYLLGLCIVGIAYMHHQTTSQMQVQIDHLQQELVVVRAENKELYLKYIELAKTIRNN